MNDIKYIHYIAVCFLFELGRTFLLFLQSENLRAIEVYKKVSILEQKIAEIRTKACYILKCLLL